MSDSPAVATIAKSNTSRALGTLTSAFIADPFFRWAYPDAENYLSAFPKLIEAYCGSGISDATGFEVSDFAGVSIWLSPGHEADDEAASAAVMATMRPERMEDFVGVMEQMDTYHPHDEPLWYLPVIGVDALSQGEGLGSVLLSHTLRRCDEEGTRAYLESSNPANIPFYERHGFAVMGKIEVGSAPPVHPMIREARS